MKQNLDTLRGEIPDYVESRNLVVFPGYARHTEGLPVVYWDVLQHPDYRSFVQAAECAGVRLMVFHARELSADLVDDALARLEESELPREEVRSYEHLLRELRAYEGFTCEIELSFDLGSRTYLFNLRTDWYDELEDILDEIEASCAASGEEDDEGPMGGGYFSRN